MFNKLVLGLIVTPFWESTHYHKFIFVVWRFSCLKLRKFIVHLYINHFHDGFVFLNRSWSAGQPLNRSWTSGQPLAQCGMARHGQVRIRTLKQILHITTKTNFRVIFSNLINAVTVTIAVLFVCLILS